MRGYIPSVGWGGIGIGSSCLFLVLLRAGFADADFVDILRPAERKTHSQVAARQLEGLF